MGNSGSAPEATREDIRRVFSELDEPHTPLTTAEVSKKLDSTERTVRENLEALVERGEFQSRQLDDQSRVWWSSGDADGLAGQQSELEEFGQFVRAVEEYAIFMLGPDGTVVSWNEGAKRIKGYSEDEIVGEHFSIFYTDDDIDEDVPERNLDVAATEGRCEDEGWRVRKDGTRFWADVDITAIRDDDGELKGYTKVTRDMTERKEQRRKIEKSERLYRTLAQNFPNGAVGVYDRDLRYTLVAGEKIGDPLPSAEEIEGTRMPDQYPDDAVADLEPLFRAAIEDGESGSVQTTVAGRNWRAWTTPLRDGDGEIYAGLSFTQDVTEQVERERELERTLGLLERTERIADVGGWEIDPETQDVFWSDHVFELLEVPGDEEPPLDEALDMYHEADKTVVEDAVENALATGDPFDVEGRIRTRSGEIRWLRLRGVPETVDGEVVSLRGAAQDVTERKHREQRLEELIDRLEESNERLEQFAYAASHDLQEPLRMVSSYLRLIEQRYADDLDADGREFIDFAVDGADRMRDMIEGLLQYSRVETRGDSFEPVDLNAVLADARNDLQVRVEETDAEITAEELPVVEGDGGQLRQVFQNLLDNAIEYSGDEPPRIHVSAERSGDWWELSIRDEGIGIDYEDSDRVFEVFQSLHTNDEHAGTGIGLALCERIVERHGGEIWVDSEPGDRSTFTFALPARDDQRE